MEDTDGRHLFEGVVFAIIPSDDISEEKEGELVQALEASGGRFIPLRSTDNEIEDVNSLTHILSSHTDFPQFSESLRRGIFIVKPSWVIQSIYKKKLSAPRQHSPDPNQFFHDVIVTCATLPEGDNDAICAGVLALGGQYSGALTKVVTHIVTTDLEHAKCKTALNERLRCKIVLPHWFDDCLKLGKKINERPYQFPDPQYLSRQSSGLIRPGPTPQLDGATTADPDGEPSLTPSSSPSEARRRLDAFRSKKVFLCDDLQINRHLRATFDSLINKAGGTVTRAVDDCDIYIGRLREGDEYVQASQAEKCVANLAWLFHVINRNRYTNPLNRLLHYPIPPAGVPGFENMKISISNYSGDARVYVENLIRYSGAEFTKTMKQDNTHLITAHATSEKCEAAQEWNINMVNHLWLEESYAKCAVQTLANPRYSHFPIRTNLGEVAGQTSLDMKVVERLYFPRPKRSPQKLRSSPLPPLSKVDTLAPNISAIDPTAADNDGPDDSPPERAEGDPDTETEAEAEAATPTPARRPRGRPPKSAAATPRVREDEKENESPLPASTSRASKMKAANNLRIQADDIALYQKEAKRKGGVTHGGRRSSLAQDASSPAPARRTSKKRPSDEYDVTAEGSALSDGETQKAAAPQAKKAKLNPSALPPIRHRMMLTGDKRWATSSSKESSDRAKLRQLGVLIITEPQNVDILVAPKLLRTKKFVTALAWAPMVVDTQYLDSALQQNKLIADPALLVDRETEERYGFTLAASLKRARTNQRKLFRGWTVFVTKEVNGGFETYKDIVECNGGAAVLYQGRTGVKLPKRLRNDPEAGPELANQGGEEEFGRAYLVSGGSDAEAKLWKKFRETAEKQGFEARVTTTEWLLQAALSQRIEWKAEWEPDGA